MSADLITSLVQAQKRRAGREHSHAKFEPHSAPAPIVKLKTSDALADTNEANKELPAVSRRIALFEKQKKSAPAHTTAIRIRVGVGDDVKHFEADANALRALSAYFQQHLPRSSSLEELELPHEDPSAFQMFIEWCKKPKQTTNYQPGQYTEEPWLSQSVAAWTLGHRLGAQRYEIYALSQFIQNCAVILHGPWKYIEDNVPSKTALSRFSKHWVAWNVHYASRGTNEYSDLLASRLASHVKPSTRDPRIFDLHHWYSDCGDDINAQCGHDPVLKEQEQQAALRRDRPKPTEWGAEQEALASMRRYSTSYATF